MIQKIFITSLILLIAINNVSALSVNLGNPQAIFRGNVGGEINYSLITRNSNNFSINVSVGKPDLNIIFFNQLDFVLIPNESREIFYKIKSTKSGIYQESIPVYFSGNGESFFLQQLLIFNITGENRDLTENHDSKSVDEGITEKNTAGINKCDGNTCQISLENQTNYTQNLGLSVNFTNDKKSNWKKYAIIILSVLIIVAMIITLIYISRKNQPDKEKIMNQGEI